MSHHATICVLALLSWTACAVQVVQIPPPVSASYQAPVSNSAPQAADDNADADADARGYFESGADSDGTPEVNRYFVRDFRVVYNQTMAHRGLSRWIGGDSDFRNPEFHEFYTRELRQQLQLRIQDCVAPGSGALDARVVMAYYEPRAWTIAGLPAYYPFVGYWPLQIVEGRFESRLELRFASGEKQRVAESFRERRYLYAFYRNEIFENRIRESLQTLFRQAARAVCAR